MMNITWLILPGLYSTTTNNLGVSPDPYNPWEPSDHSMAFGGVSLNITIIILAQKVQFFTPNISLDG